MRAWFIVLLSCSSFLAFGQGAFPTDDAEWVVLSNSPILGPNDDYRVWRYTLEGDTLVDGWTYSQVWLQSLCYSITNPNAYQSANPSYKAKVALVRADEDRIYAIVLSFPKAKFPSYGDGVKSFPTDTLVVVADFAVEPGDTVQYPTGTTLQVVQKSTLPDGRRSVVLEQLTNPPFQSEWLEGQGCTKGLFETTFYWFNYGACFQTPIGAGNCPLPCTPADPILVATTSPAGPGIVRVYPNPTSDILHLSIPDPLAPMDLVLLDITGHPVLVRKAVRDQETLDLSGLAPGSYICQVSSPRGEFQVFKVVRLP
ncbi:MAG: T9SS type A sorting domain-containing protein [Saprospiraceae bacterium]